MSVSLKGCVMYLCRADHSSRGILRKVCDQVYRPLHVQWVGRQRSN